VPRGAPFALEARLLRALLAPPAGASSALKYTSGVPGAAMNDYGTVVGADLQSNGRKRLLDAFDGAVEKEDDAVSPVTSRGRGANLALGTENSEDVSLPGPGPEQALAETTIYMYLRH
jgi:hypothetical protein